MNNLTAKTSIAMVMIISICLLADPPRTLTYQGKLTDAGGVAESGSHTIVFKIWKDETSTASADSLWAEQLAVMVTNGLFDVILGETTPIDLPFDEQYWIELKVGTETLAPREKLATVPYAHRAVYAEIAEYEIGDGGIPSDAYIAFPSSSSLTGWTYTEQNDGSIAFGDIVGDTWTSKELMSDVRSSGAAASVNGKVYVIGGSNSGELSLNEEYDPVTDSWTTKSPMPTAREGLVAVAVDDKIYAMGGYNAGGYSNKNEVYDPVTDSWMTKTDLPHATIYPGASDANEKIYVIGGRDGSGILAYNQEYDPDSDTWSLKASLGSGRERVGAAAASVDNKVYLIGGMITYPDSDPVDYNDEYDPATDTWTVKSSMPTSRGFLVAVAVDNSIYAITGSGSTGRLATNEQYLTVSDNWATKQNFVWGFDCGMAAEANGRIYFAGGYAEFLGNRQGSYEYCPSLDFFWFQKD